MKTYVRKKLLVSATNKFLNKKNKSLVKIKYLLVIIVFIIRFHRVIKI